VVQFCYSRPIMTINMAKQTKAARWIDPDRAKRDVFVLGDHHRPLETPWHSHARAQLIHVSRGVLTVRTKDGLWMVPPQRAVWILPGTQHKIASKKNFWLTTLYAKLGIDAIPEKSSVVSIDRLTDELLIAAAHFGPGYPLGGPEERLIKVLLERLPQLPVSSLYLQEPRDQKLKRITDALIATPARPETLAELSAKAHLTERTAARLFVRETGLTFGQWRQQLRVLTALEELGAGASVTAAALNVGYQDVSSFITAFKRIVGDTPSKCFR
jgi:AraC-like DNA-binding protein